MDDLEWDTRIGHQNGVMNAKTSINNGGAIYWTHARVFPEIFVTQLNRLHFARLALQTVSYALNHQDSEPLFIEEDRYLTDAKEI